MKTITNELGVTYHQWKYQNIDGDDTGYNQLNKEVLSQYNDKLFAEASKEKQEQMIDEVFNLIRGVNIYPGVYYYTESDIIEEIRACRNKALPNFDGNILDKRPTYGNSLLKFLFPNFHLIECKGVKNNSLYERWIDDWKLRRSIEFCFKFKPKIKEPLTSYSIADGMQMIGGNTGNNYLPLKARMLVEHFMPNGGNYLDFSCGFGGRLLGVCASPKPIRYFGFEPNSETFYYLQNRLKPYIEEAYCFDQKDSMINLYQQGSEVEIPEEIVGKIDFAFSCPPYFNLEKYCSEDTQCYIKYPTLELWLNEYVAKTIENLHKALKNGGLYAVNIADFKVGKDDIHFVDKWIELSKMFGFKFVKEIVSRTGRSRPNNKSNQQVYIPKVESIYVFQK